MPSRNQIARLAAGGDLGLLRTKASYEEPSAQRRKASKDRNATEGKERGLKGVNRFGNDEIPVHEGSGRETSAPEGVPLVAEEAVVVEKEDSPPVPDNLEGLSDDSLFKNPTLEGCELEVDIKNRLEGKPCACFSDWEEQLEYYLLPSLFSDVHKSKLCADHPRHLAGGSAGRRVVRQSILSIAKKYMPELIDLNIKLWNSIDILDTMNLLELYWGAVGERIEAMDWGNEIQCGIESLRQVEADFVAQFSTKELLVRGLKMVEYHDQLRQANQEIERRVGELSATGGLAGGLS